jgi:hypothetical protein
MPFLVSLTVLLTVVVLVNLALTVGLVRRIRDYDSRLHRLEQGSPTMADIGERVGEFSAVTVDGDEITRGALVPGTIVGFFDPQCETCHSHLPGFAAAARSLPGGRSQTLAVVRDEEDFQEMVDVLAGDVRVVLERRRGPVSRAFKVAAIPSFCLLGPDQTVATHDLAQLEASVA